MFRALRFSGDGSMSSIATSRTSCGSGLSGRGLWPAFVFFAVALAFTGDLLWWAAPRRLVQRAARCRPQSALRCTREWILELQLGPAQPALAGPQADRARADASLGAPAWSRLDVARLRSPAGPCRRQADHAPAPTLLSARQRGPASAPLAFERPLVIAGRQADRALRRRFCRRASVVPPRRRSAVDLPPASPPLRRTARGAELLSARRGAAGAQRLLRRQPRFLIPSGWIDGQVRLPPLRSGPLSARTRPRALHEPDDELARLPDGALHLGSEVLRPASRLERIQEDVESVLQELRVAEPDPSARRWRDCGRLDGRLRRRPRMRPRVRHRGSRTPVSREGQGQKLPRLLERHDVQREVWRVRVLRARRLERLEHVNAPPFRVDEEQQLWTVPIRERRAVRGRLGLRADRRGDEEPVAACLRRRRAGVHGAGRRDRVRPPFRFDEDPALPERQLDDGVRAHQVRLELRVVVERTERDRPVGVAEPPERQITRADRSPPCGRHGDEKIVKPEVVLEIRHHRRCRRVRPQVREERSDGVVAVVRQRPGGHLRAFPPRTEEEVLPDIATPAWKSSGEHGQTAVRDRDVSTRERERDELVRREAPRDREEAEHVAVARRQRDRFDPLAYFDVGRTIRAALDVDRVAHGRPLGLEPLPHRRDQLLLLHLHRVRPEHERDREAGALACRFRDRIDCRPNGEPRDVIHAKHLPLLVIFRLSVRTDRPLRRPPTRQHSWPFSIPSLIEPPALAAPFRPAIDRSVDRHPLGHAPCPALPCSLSNHPYQLRHPSTPPPQPNPLTLTLPSFSFFFLPLSPFFSPHSHHFLLPVLAPPPSSPLQLWSQFPDPSPQWLGERGRETGTRSVTRWALACWVGQGQPFPRVNSVLGA